MIKADKTIQKGMWWNDYGFDKTITFVSADHKKCRIREEWISEDTYKQCHCIIECDIIEKDGEEYAVPVKYPNHSYAATSAWNYPEEEAENSIYAEYEEHYCPSATAHDYSPSSPWNAPGMSIRDFI